MSTKDPNMKVIFGADTKDFEKGAKEVKQGLKDLDKSTTSMLSSIGNAFGVDTRKVEQMTSAMKGLGQKMSECGNAGVSAFGSILKAIGPVGGAIAGLGLSVAIAEFKSLKAEAEAFKQTVQGANMEMATAAYIDTYKQILRDFDGDFAKSLAQTESTWKKTWTQIGQSFKQLFRTGAFGELVGNYQGGGVEEYSRRMNAANEGAQKAEDLTNRIYELERQRKTQAVEVAKINDQIADALLIAKDATASVADRNAAIAQAEGLLATKKKMTVDLEEQLADLYAQRSNLASDSIAAEDATLAQAARQYEVSRSITQEEMSLLKVKNSIGKASDAEIARMNKLIEQQKALQKAIDEVHAKWSGMSAVSLAGLQNVQGGVIGPSLSILPQQTDTELFKQTFLAQLGEIKVGIGFEADTEKIHDITNEVTSLVQNAVTRTSEIIGNLVGTLAAGGDAWGDFKNAALSAFGDMAIAVGKIAVSAGVATLGIKAAFESMNGYAAIAAGAALIALGSAVKASLSSVANGDYSASAGGYSSSGYSSTGSNNYETREVTVSVTGTLEADGDKLITVLNNTNKKNYYTR